MKIEWSEGRFGLTTGATSSTKGFGEPWLRRTVASRSFGSDGCMHHEWKGVEFRLSEISGMQTGVD